MTDKKRASIVGWLFIAGTIAGILSAFFFASILGKPDYLSQIVAHQVKFTLSVSLVLVMGFSLALIPLILYPILREQNEVLALGYVIFRGGLETVTYLGIAGSWLLLSTLSGGNSAAGAIDNGSVSTISFMLKKAAEVSAIGTAIIFPIGAIMLYIIFYQSTLIPRWLSVWGLIGALLHFAISGLAGMFTLAKPLPEIISVLNIPIAIQEMCMAVYLIIKGFVPIRVNTDCQNVSSCP